VSLIHWKFHLPRERDLHDLYLAAGWGFPGGAG